jgi:RimJ/RimL family protein N-acetyltransferase
MELLTDRLKIREIEAADLETIHHLYCLPETDKFNTFGIPETSAVTKQLVMEWISAQIAFPRKKYVFAITARTLDFIGLIGLTFGKSTYKNAELWYKIHPKYWNQGFATEAIYEILKLCFTEFNLHRVTAGCAVENIASIRVLEKVGMIKEGQGRKILPIRGEWIDNFEFSILETDYLFGKGAKNSL